MDGRFYSFEENNLCCEEQTLPTTDPSTKAYHILTFPLQLGPIPTLIAEVQ